MITREELKHLYKDFILQNGGQWLNIHYEDIWVPDREEILEYIKEDGKQISKELENDFMNNRSDFLPVDDYLVCEWNSVLEPQIESMI